MPMLTKHRVRSDRTAMHVTVNLRMADGYSTKPFGASQIYAAVAAVCHGEDSESSLICTTCMHVNPEADSFRNLEGI